MKVLFITHEVNAVNQPIKINSLTLVVLKMGRQSLETVEATERTCSISVLQIRCCNRNFFLLREKRRTPQLNREVAPFPIKKIEQPLGFPSTVLGNPTE